MSILAVPPAVEGRTTGGHARAWQVVGGTVVHRLGEVGGQRREVSGHEQILRSGYRRVSTLG